MSSSALRQSAGLMSGCEPIQFCCMRQNNGGIKDELRQNNGGIKDELRQNNGEIKDELRQNNGAVWQI